MLDNEQLKEARERDGERADERPDEADVGLERDYPAVGFSNGDPLLNRDYSEYPRSDDILSPDASGVLETLVEHRLIGSVRDISDELRADVTVVSKALELHDVDRPESVEDDAQPSESEIELPDGTVVATEQFRSPIYRDARLLEYLYVDCGYSIAEMREFLESERNHGRGAEKPRWTVDNTDIRTELEMVGLLIGDGDDGERDDIRLGGASLSESETSGTDGLTVSTSDF
ncbi:unknown [Haloarcula marismortui ATCC 43049]|uniref:Uncharacterized protein n=1 Tax=Haloarcula marismortui (strain ATCC 43049 / DSM 3752 / JCM 8966 / VKM B-1809) TaxID=272569 RepID=Q5V182_HALMA|nr:hypothetical protein [Haloarcula marismortui]AAV46721.1 unknown [Haloarcula marismortui ATCC 43049]QCP91433.1 hypothetical protein E6P14_11440 [Haloarcula marismortui ATCC 43049]